MVPETASLMWQVRKAIISALHAMQAYHELLLFVLYHISCFRYLLTVLYASITMGKEQSKLKPRDLSELSRATTFSEQEIKAYYKEFKRNSKTGTMKVDDFKKLYSNFFPDGDPSEFAEHTFRVFDQNGDGILDFRELIVSMSVMKRGNVDDRLKWAFTMYDIDGNGYITR